MYFKRFLTFVEYVFDRRPVINFKGFGIRAAIAAAAVCLVLAMGVYAGSRMLFQSSPLADTEDLSRVTNLHLVELLNVTANDRDILGQVITEAGKRHDFTVTRQLAFLSVHPDYRTRIQVAKALGQPFHIASPEAFGGLLQLLDDNDFLVRAYAAKSLCRMGTARAYDTLKRHAENEDNEIVRTTILKTLTKAKQL